MKQYPVAYAHQDLEVYAGVLIGQLEERDNDPILLLTDDCGKGTSPAEFRRGKHLLPHGQWCWTAIDGSGRQASVARCRSSGMSGSRAR